MENADVIKNLKQSVTKLKGQIDDLQEIRDGIPELNEEQRKKIDTLDSEIAEMIANKHALEVIINEREAAEEGSIPPLSPNLVAKFEKQMQKLNVVIQADQNFDKIVAVAKGINSAAAEMETTAKT